MHVWPLQSRPIALSLIAVLVSACAPYDVAALADAAPVDTAPAVQAPEPSAPEAPLALGTAPAEASATQQAALWWVNTFRARVGLGPVDEVAPLNASATAHALYVLTHPELYDEGQGLSVHVESPGKDGFTGANFWERMASAGYAGAPFREVIAYQANPAAAVAHWMETVYHRLPIVHPAARHVGYAEAHLGTSTIDVLDMGSGHGKAKIAPSGVVWPPDGARDVPLSWDGLESPAPPAPPGGFPSGPVVTLTFGSGLELSVSKHELIDASGGGGLVPHVLLTPDSDPNLDGETSVVMYANAPLAPGHTYQALVEGEVKGKPFSRSWTFTTRDTTGCSLVAQDCGVGKGCYGTHVEGAVCAWAGAKAAGSACGFQNDCAPGLTCVGEVCRAYCPLASCEHQCIAGSTTLDVPGGIGLCEAQ